jgi:hypothetical protein
MRKIFGRCATMIRNWKVLVKAEAGDLERWAAKLECTEAQDPPPPPPPNGSGSSAVAPVTAGRAL